MALNKDAARQLRNIFGEDACYFSATDCWPYGYDNSKQHHCPEAVVLPTSHQQVVDTIRLCNQFRIPVTSRGRGTGTTGASVPIHAGLVLSLERMTQLVEIHRGDRTAVTEPGITNQALQDRLGQDRFFWAPDPGSAAYCTVGGNIACNAAGPRALKYGATRENVLGLKIVTGIGDTIVTGTRTTKSAVGYDLTRLLIGSEGTLGIITQATLKIIPLPGSKITLRALYTSDQAACEAVANVMSHNPTPCALEFLDTHAVKLVTRHSQVQLPDTARAILMAEIDGDEHCVNSDATALSANLRNSGCIEVQSAISPEEITELWAARKSLSPILRTLAPDKINEDVVVPVSALPALINAANQTARQSGLPIVCFGHAGNGNLHINIMYDRSNPQENRNACSALNEIFNTVLRLGGTLSGEHGVGIAKRDFIASELDSDSIHLMQAIKKQFDPNLILNPGKSLPDL